MNNLARHVRPRALLLARKSGVLSTISIDQPDFPFGSVVPYCFDRSGYPVILISDIAQHTHNAVANPRVCLTVLADGDDVQAAARLSCLALAGPIPAEEVEDAAERYYRHFPASRGYHQVHGFSFFGLQPVRLRWIGGFGDISWIEPAEFSVPNPFSRREEAGIVEHMNADHEPAMRGYCGPLAGVDPRDDESVRMAGIDAEGFDLLIGDRRLLRFAFPAPVTTLAEARGRLVALARKTRGSGVR